jgi:hypothetical protein
MIHTRFRISHLFAVITSLNQYLSWFSPSDIRHIFFKLSHVKFLFMKIPRNKFQNLLIDIGSHLADLRVKKGYPTIKEFAAKYELPEIHYWRIEKGKANPTLKSLVRILAIHKISIQDFFCMIADQKLAA